MSDKPAQDSSVVTVKLTKYARGSLITGSSPSLSICHFSACNIEKLRGQGNVGGICMYEHIKMFIFNLFLRKEPKIEKETIDKYSTSHSIILDFLNTGQIKPTKTISLSFSRHSKDY